jgi:hypothetical protein
VEKVHGFTLSNKFEGFEAEKIKPIFIDKIKEWVCKPSSVDGDHLS